MQQPAANPYGLNCPRCGGGFVTKPSFTWWGGLLGPALLSHAVCGQCHFGFNWKTGKSNTNAIIIYYAVIFGILILGGIVSAAAH